MKTIKVRNLIIGEGTPKIVIPIVGNTKEDIIEKAIEIKDMSLDLVEWRVDYFENIFIPEEVLMVLEILRKTLGDKLIIFTIRTRNEGGEKEIPTEFYIYLNILVAKSGLADFVDIEVFQENLNTIEIIQQIHDCGCLVIGSNHNFYETLDKNILVERLKKMQDMGSDIPKIAMMPNSIEDLLTLLWASVEIKAKYADRPFMAISMGKLGLISRLTGEIFGSALTFGTVGKISAPGQIPLEDLEFIMKTIHKSIN